MLLRLGSPFAFGRLFCYIHLVTRIEDPKVLRWYPAAVA